MYIFPVLLIVLCLCGDVAWATPVCKDKCCRFLEGFPIRLRRLRQDFTHIRDYYEANDDLDGALLDKSVRNSIHSPFGCHAIKNILEFYLGTVLPSAIADVPEDGEEYKPHMESIQLIFDELKSNIINCRNYFDCKNPFDITQLNSTYMQMKRKGLYKAMGELDILFNFVEKYLASKRRGQ